MNTELIKMLHNNLSLLGASDELLQIIGEWHAGADEKDVTERLQNCAQKEADLVKHRLARCTSTRIKAQNLN